MHVYQKRHPIIMSIKTYLRHHPIGFVHLLRRPGSEPGPKHRGPAHHW